MDIPCTSCILQNGFQRIISHCQEFAKLSAKVSNLVLDSFYGIKLSKHQLVSTKQTFGYHQSNWA